MGSFINSCVKSVLVFILLFQVYVLSAQDTTRVLFVGNSITYYNDMPFTVEAIANSKGDAAKVFMHAPGGTGFMHHVDNPALFDLIRQGSWDYVVLQPGSSESIAASATVEESLERIRLLQDSIYRYSPCAKTLFYQIPYGVWGSSPEDLETYNNTIDKILENVSYWSDSTWSFFAPAGEAIRTAWNQDQSIMFWGSTGNVHPNERGSYIIACVFYATIFQKPSLGTNVVGSLSPDDAQAYQQLADTTVLNHLPDWRINVYNQLTDFEYMLEEATVSFVSTSQYIDSLRWDFGDGYTSAQAEVTHTYTADGTYEVSLTTYQHGCKQEKTVSIEVDHLSVPAFERHKSMVYPNPFATEFVIQSYQGGDIRLFNLLGQDCTHLLSVSLHGDRVEVQAQVLPKGIYVLKYDGANILLRKD